MSAPAVPSPAPPLLGRLISNRALALAVIALATVLPRLAELPTAREDRMPPDAAHFLNVARCFERGQGFSNPSAWPAWMKPARLPMPETFKEPGYPWLISRAARAGAAPFQAGLALSLLAGLLLPFAVWLLARQIEPDPAVALVAALIAAGSPLLVDKSVSVLVESLFALFIAITFIAAGWRLGDPARAQRPLWLDALTGALFGASWLLRAQTLLALPSVLVLLFRARPARRSLAGLALGAVSALIVLSPFLARNLRLFGVPFYSDVPAFGLWPYVDHITFAHGLDRPGSPIAFAFAHPTEVLRHVGWSLRTFLFSALPRELYGNPLWVPAFAVGVALGLPRWRDWLFAWAYVGLTVGFILAVHWDTYYFTSNMAAWCVVAALGAVGLARRMDHGRPHALALNLVIALALLQPALVAARRPAAIAAQVPTEIEAAIHEGPALRARLASDEAVMVERTSYWAWFTDRNAVHLVVADSVRFLESVRRLKVRWAALPTALLPDYMAHYPDRRMPSILVEDHADPARGITVYRLVDPGAPVDSSASEVGSRPDLP